MTGYIHSETFANLKGIKESISNNLTSYQYLSVLDELLYRSIYPLLESTQFVELFMSQVLGWQTQNPKRKTSGVGRKALSTRVTLLLLSSSPKQKLKVLKSMRLDRAVLFEILRRWLKLAESIELLGTQPPTTENIIKLHSLSSKCCLRPGYSLALSYRASSHWLNQALSFKQKILEKYVRLCLVTAKRDYEDLDHKVPLNDIVQVYLLTASKAIDKCDSEKGVLTSHVQNWLLSAKNAVVSTYLSGSGADSRSMTVSSTTNKRVVDSVIESSQDPSDLGELTHSDDDVRSREEELFIIRKVAKAFDPTGYGRIALHIEEVLSPTDQKLLMSLAVYPLVA